MITITLPDGSTKEFAEPCQVYEVAASIGAGLAKATLAGEVNGLLVDADYLIEQDACLRIITSKDPEGLEIIRHSAAHLLAQAVKALYPSAQVTIGPVIAEGFYYDFAFGRAFTPEDLEKIEAEMQKLAKQDLIVNRQMMSREEAVQYFSEIGEHYKVEIIKDLPGDEPVSVYQQGGFLDLCRGPHVPSTKHLKHFKLTKVSGAYWRGDSDNEMLQRIYGTAWASKQELKDYLTRLEEAERRDHRKVGKTLELFHLQPEAAGMVFWHPKGWALYLIIENYIRNLLVRYGYQEIKTPIIASKALWEKSGHWDKFADEMFITSSEERDYAVKPMNCPGHVQVFNQGLKSYRDLPLRLAEFGCCHRNEPSGALHGLMRVRGFTQDDAHIFCERDQIQEEVASFIDLLYQAYHDFGFEQILVRLATRPEQRIGGDEIWDEAEQALSQALSNKQLEWEELPGEGAFYGPKIEFSLKDCLGRVWQCGTLQVDFSMPARLGAEYIAEDGSKKAPVMLHRAILGSFERFIAILIEHYEGKFPAWLAPEQVVVMNITDRQAHYAQKVTEILKNHGFRAISDLRNEKIGFKIREHTLNRVPYQIVVGDKESDSETVAVRIRTGEDLGSMKLSDFIAKLQEAVDSRSQSLAELKEEA